MKNRIKSYWSNCLSIAAIICSVVAICVSLPSAPELGIDYIGVIVGILSLLVTMLIGWQIWNVIAIDKKIDGKVEQTSDSLTKSIDATKKEMIDYIQKANEKSQAEIMASLLFLQGDTLLLKSQYESALLRYLDIISDIIEKPYIENYSDAIDACISKAREAKKLVNHNELKRILKVEKRDSYLKALLKIEGHKAIDIIIFLRGL
ncbi:hypothetical protein [Bacteroides caccae]|jgi:hypothetical protein|uniref:hypothetical protein n=1 Tax=Bacteroides caccae TaxID=47678 RepID=UPI00123102C5|nr:hypothetical protein [Bacteroides caccae]KAA5451027.1 hypothetical protein F2Y38_14065 [Bacteroides caccae]KAA5452385.1 hypothetical protein F2Y48_03500 [Bacteroides caccae]KAA5459332.1 hypothetical protein F2Y50_09250 [Bacteroides caccae]KAA5473570.1 hypothetical protein F2Y34_07525 [Bacteroides caccae]